MARIPSKDELLAWIAENPDASAKRDIARAFGIRGADRIELKRLLKEMAEEGSLEKRRRSYRDPDRLNERLTALHQLTRPEFQMRAAAERLLPALQNALASLPVSVEIVPLQSQIGSGSLPVDRLPSAGFAIRPQGKKSGVLHRIETALRGLPRPVIGRIDNGEPAPGQGDVADVVVGCFGRLAPHRGLILAPKIAARVQVRYLPHLTRRVGVADARQ